MKNKEFRLRNSRAERGRFSDIFLLRASAHPAEHFCVIGNAVSYDIKNVPKYKFPYISGRIIHIRGTTRIGKFAHSSHNAVFCVLPYY